MLPQMPPPQTLLKLKMVQRKSQISAAGAAVAVAATIKLPLLL